MEKTAKDVGIIPSYFNTIAVGEGLNLFIDSNYDINPPYNVIISNPLNGFDVLGTDDFGSEFSRYKKYLPKTFNERKTVMTLKQVQSFINKLKPMKLNKETITGVFKDLETALWAFGVTLAHRKNFFVNQGKGNAKRWLKSNGSYDITTNKTERGQVHILATERVATWRYVQTKEIFSE